ncbi:MAG: hypothetical protein KDM63_20775, partial [Verrucomicrobiae bacterium]|nr:hypothetical protein [Verrucomicrobiae bacterium]
FSYAQVGNGGANDRGQEHNGNITFVMDGDILVEGGTPIRDSEQSQAEIDNPILDNTGNIAHGVANYAQIGHGGWDSDPQAGNLNLAVGTGGFFGDIEVVSVSGSVMIIAGGDPSISVNDDSLNRGNSAQIGHGGNFTDGDHRGNIRVAAGQDVGIFASGGSRDSYSQIGHGGHQVDGNLEGDIEVVAGNDLIMNRGGDTDTGTAGTGMWGIRQNNATSGTTISFVRLSATLENTAPFSIFSTAPTGANQPAIPAGTVVTSGVDHGFSVGDRVVFNTLTGGTGLSANTVYYITSVPSSTSFEVSGTPGGPAIGFSSNITAATMQKLLDVTGSSSSDTITTTVPHGLLSGDRIVFADIAGGEGGGLANGTEYFIRDVTANSFKVSTSRGGAAINITSDILTTATLQRPDANVDQFFRSTRDGNEIFNNFAHIGHGDHLYRQRSSGAGTRNGDI